MAGYYVFRKWYFKDATSHWEAREMLQKAEKAGIDKNHFQGEWTKEIEQPFNLASAAREVVKQVTGMKGK